MHFKMEEAYASICSKTPLPPSKHYVQGGSVKIRVNDDVGHNFQTSKGLRQDDPLSLILFNSIAYMLAILISRAKEEGKSEAFYLILLMVVCIYILQHADDTILFMEHDIEKAVSMKSILVSLNNYEG
jgi:hypothetical protein